MMLSMFKKYFFFWLASMNPFTRSISISKEDENSILEYLQSKSIRILHRVLKVISYIQRDYVDYACVDTDEWLYHNWHEFIDQK